MRDFFINSLEMLVAVIIVVMAIGTVIGALGTMFSGQPGGFFTGIVILIAGSLYTILMGGMLYLFLGIYQNTKRTADLLERQHQ